MRKQGQRIREPRPVGMRLEKYKAIGGSILLLAGVGVLVWIWIQRFHEIARWFR